MLFLPSVAHAFWSLLDIWHTFQSPFWLQARPERVPQRTKRVATAQWPENGCSVPVLVCPSAVELSPLIPLHHPHGYPHNHHKSSPKIHRRGINGALFQSWEGPMAFLVGALVILTRGGNRGEPRVGIAPLVCSLCRLWENHGKTLGKWWFIQCEAPKIDKLVYKSNNYGLSYL